MEQHRRASTEQHQRPQELAESNDGEGNPQHIETGASWEKKENSPILETDHNVRNRIEPTVIQDQAIQTRGGVLAQQPGTILSNSSKEDHPNSRFFTDSGRPPIQGKSYNDLRPLTSVDSQASRVGTVGHQSLSEHEESQAVGQSMTANEADDLLPAPQPRFSNQAPKSDYTTNASSQELLARQTPSESVIEEPKGKHATTRSKYQWAIQAPQIGSHSTSTDKRRESRPEYSGAPLTRDVSPPSPLPQRKSEGRPFSFIEFSHNEPPRPLEDYSRRDPSIESFPSQPNVDQDRPPSPISPQQSMIYESNDQHSRSEPAYLGPNQKLNPEVGYNEPGRLSQSFSRPLQDPNLQDHPAFRHEPPYNRHQDPPPRWTGRDISSTHSHASEAQLPAVGPPIPRTNGSTPTSKRGSRSSAFFKSFKSPAESSPPISQQPDSQTGHISSNDAVAQKPKSKRTSLLRSLTGGPKGDLGENTPKNHTSPELVQSPQQAPTMSGISQEETLPAKSQSKYRNRLSRTPQTVDQETQGSGKKKRFSGIGVGWA